MERIPQHYFEKSISTLFFFGQLPVLVFSSVIVLIITGCYGTKSNWFFVGVLISALFSFSFSIAAVVKYRSSQNTARVLLYFSMVFTLIFLTCLIRITSGSTSPFFHLYLYMPAVVFMVAQRDRRAEIICSVGVFISFLFNHGIVSDWEAWKSFHTTYWYQSLEIAIIAFLLVLLSLVNKQIEELVKIKD